ncbi:MAG: hypothetical protein AAGG80_04110 [Pseudomonadota bacterium]
MNIIKILLACCISLSFVSFSLAQGGGDTAKAVKNLVGGYGENHLPKKKKKSGLGGILGQTKTVTPKDNLSIFAPSPSAKQTNFSSEVVKNFAQQLKNLVSLTAKNNNQQTKKQLPTLTDRALFNILTAEPSKRNRIEISAFKDVKRSPVGAAALEKSTLDAPYYEAKNNKALQDKKKPNALADFNLDSLLAVSQFVDKDGKSDDDLAAAARKFISFMSGQVQPLATISLSSMSKENLKAALSESAIPEYLVKLMSYAAKNSVGISNLYMLYNERVPRKIPNNINSSTLENANIPQQLRKEASPLAIDKYMAYRRLKDPDWYIKMETKATPATIQREMLYVLVEMRYELFKTRMLNERMLATMSALQLQNLGQERISITLSGNSVCSTYAGKITCPKPSLDRPAGL